MVLSIIEPIVVTLAEINVLLFFVSSDICIVIAIFTQNVIKIYSF